MNQAGMQLLKEFEGFSDKAYQDVVGVWTIGYGFTNGVKPRDTMTREAADRRLAADLIEYENAVKAACTTPPTENQLAALTCFAWNVGIAGMRKSSVIKAHNRGDLHAAAQAFAMWNKAGGRVFTGLVRRRAAEAALYLTADGLIADGEAVLSAKGEAMPQAVDEEKPLTQSRLATGGTIAATASGLSLVSQMAGDVATIRASLGDLLPWVILVAAVAGMAAGCWIVWERHQQRKRGVA